MSPFAVYAKESEAADGCLSSMLSPDGKSYSYDTRANGFGRGEGAACLIVKRLADAVRDGDSIRAVVRNTAASHSGRTNGITMPSQSAQVQLLTRLHQEVGLDPRDTGYVEVSRSIMALIAVGLVNRGDM